MASDSPFDAAIGLFLVGFGVLLGYTTVKHVPGGAIGAVKNALSTGQLINNVKLKPAAQAKTQASPRDPGTPPHAEVQ